VDEMEKSEGVTAAGTRTSRRVQQKGIAEFHVDKALSVLDLKCKVCFQINFSTTRLLICFFLDYGSMEYSPHPPDPVLSRGSTGR
jgi:hypothetical protein